MLWLISQPRVLAPSGLSQVSKWHDLSISSRGFVQATARQQPLYEMNGINGISSIRTADIQGMRMSTIWAAPCSVFAANDGWLQQ